jgi:hypothetical protein
MTANDVPPAIRRVFNDVRAALPRIDVKEYPSTPGKLGLRTDGSRVVLTYNSYKEGWLDTSARLGPRLHWFGVTPTHNKGDQYWAAELSPESVEEIYRTGRAEILAVLSEYIAAA